MGSEYPSLEVRDCVNHCLHHPSACEPSRFSRVWFFATLCSVACLAPLSMGFSRQEYWSGLPCSPPGDLPNPWIKPASLTSPALAGGFFTTSTTWEAQLPNTHSKTHSQIHTLDFAPSPRYILYSARKPLRQAGPRCHSSYLVPPHCQGEEGLENALNSCGQMWMVKRHWYSLRSCRLLCQPHLALSNQQVFLNSSSTRSSMTCGTTSPGAG